MSINDLPDELLGMIADLLDPLSCKCYQQASSRARRVIKEIYKSKSDLVANTCARLELSDSHSKNPIQIRRLVSNLKHYYIAVICKDIIGKDIPHSIRREYLTLCDAYTCEMCKYYCPDTYNVAADINIKVYNEFVQHILSVISYILFYESNKKYAYCDKYIVIIIRLQEIYRLGISIFGYSQRVSDKAYIELMDHYYYPKYYLPVFMFINPCVTIARFHTYHDLRQYAFYIHPSVYTSHNHLEYLYEVVIRNGLDIRDFLEANSEALDANDETAECSDEGDIKDTDPNKATELAFERIKNHIRNYSPAVRPEYQ